MIGKNGARVRFEGITQAVRKAAERDLVDLHGKSVGTFLASAEVIRGWAVAED